MDPSYLPRGERRVDGPLLQTLDLVAATAAEEAAGTRGSMLTAAERALLIQLGRRWRGEGAVIDGGTFLGSSLVSSAVGLTRSAALDGADLARFPDGKPLHGYDLGTLPAPSRPGAPRTRVYGGQEVVLGESFVPILERNVEPYRDLVRLHIGDFAAEGWDGSPIEIAFLDLCKTPELNANATRQFLPAMIGGGSTLIHQDFFFDRLPFIRVTMGYLKDYFRWEGQVDFSSIYSNVKPVPQDVADHDPFLEGSLDECLAFHDAVEFPGIDATTRLYLGISRANLMSHKGAKEQAIDHLRELAVDHHEILGDDDDPEGRHFRLDRALNEIIGSLCRSRREAKGEAGAAAPDRRAGATPPAVARAREDLDRGDPRSAVARLDRFLGRRPRHKRALVLRGHAHLVLGDGTGARADVDRALSIDPEWPAAHRLAFDLDVADALS